MKKSIEINKPLVDTKVIFFFVLINVFITMLFLVFEKPTSDYRTYVFFWQNLLNQEGNIGGYGALFSIFAYLYQIHPNLPKLVFVMIFFSSLLLLMNLVRKSSHITDTTTKYMFYSILLFHPLFWWPLYREGINSSLEAGLLMMAFFLYPRKRIATDILCGILLSLAIGVKLTPIVMLPFLVLSKNKIRWSLLTSLTCSLAIIFYLTFIVLDNTQMTAFFNNYPARLLSIFAFLEGDFSPLKLFWEKPNVSFLSTPLIVISLVTLSFFHIIYRFSSVLSAITACFIVVTFFKVGWQQYSTIPILVLIYWLASNYKNADKRLLNAAYLFLGWSILAILISKLTYHHTRYSHFVGLPHFLVMGWITFNLIRHAFIQSKKENNFAGLSFQQIFFRLGFNKK